MGKITVFKVNCLPIHGPHYAKGYCRVCYSRARALYRRKLLKFEPKLYRYDEWLDYESLGYTVEYVAKQWGIKVASVERMIYRGRKRKEL